MSMGKRGLFYLSLWSALLSNSVRATGFMTPAPYQPSASALEMQSLMNPTVSKTGPSILHMKDFDKLEAQLRALAGAQGEVRKYLESIVGIQDAERKKRLDKSATELSLNIQNIPKDFSGEFDAIMRQIGFLLGLNGSQLDKLLGNFEGSFESKRKILEALLAFYDIKDRKSGWNDVKSSSVNRALENLAKAYGVPEGDISKMSKTLRSLGDALVKVDILNVMPNGQSPDGGAGGNKAMAAATGAGGGSGLSPEVDEAKALLDAEQVDPAAENYIPETALNSAPESPATEYVPGPSAPAYSNPAPYDASPLLNVAQQAGAGQNETGAGVGSIMPQGIGAGQEHRMPASSGGANPLAKMGNSGIGGRNLASTSRGSDRGPILSGGGGQVQQSGTGVAAGGNSAPKVDKIAQMLGVQPDFSSKETMAQMDQSALYIPKDSNSAAEVQKLAAERLQLLQLTNPTPQQIQRRRVVDGDLKKIAKHVEYGENEYGKNSDEKCLKNVENQYLIYKNSMLAKSQNAMGFYEWVKYCRIKGMCDAKEWNMGSSLANQLSARQQAYSAQEGGWQTKSNHPRMEDRKRVNQKLDFVAKMSTDNLQKLNGVLSRASEKIGILNSLVSTENAMCGLDKNSKELLKGSRACSGLQAKTLKDVAKSPPVHTDRMRLWGLSSFVTSTHQSVQDLKNNIANEQNLISSLPGANRKLASNEPLYDDESVKKMILNDTAKDQIWLMDGNLPLVHHTFRRVGFGTLTGKLGNNFLEDQLANHKCINDTKNSPLPWAKVIQELEELFRPLAKECGVLQAYTMGFSGTCKFDIAEYRRQKSADEAFSSLEENFSINRLNKCLGHGISKGTSVNTAKDSFADAAGATVSVAPVALPSFQPQKNDWSNEGRSNADNIAQLMPWLQKDLNGPERCKKVRDQYLFYLSIMLFPSHNEGSYDANRFQHSI